MPFIHKCVCMLRLIVRQFNREMAAGKKSEFKLRPQTHPPLARIFLLKHQKKVFSSIQVKIHATHVHSIISQSLCSQHLKTNFSCSSLSKFYHIIIIISSNEWNFPLSNTDFACLLREKLKSENFFQRTHFRRCAVEVLLAF